MVEEIAAEIQKQLEEKGFCYVEDLRDSDPFFGAPVQCLMENGSILQEFVEWTKVNQSSTLLPGMVPITTDDEVSFLCSSLLFVKCIGLFQEASERLAIERVKKGKKPAALELQM